MANKYHIDFGKILKCFRDPTAIFCDFHLFHFYLGILSPDTETDADSDVMRGPKVLKCSEVFKYYVSRLKIKIRPYVILEHF